MNKTRTTSNLFSHLFKQPLRSLMYAFLLIACINSFAQSNETAANNVNDTLLEQFIKSKQYNSYLDFNSNNIKQFWVDNSVFAKDNCIFINTHKEAAISSNSKYYPIQLANVDLSMDCRIDVITESDGLSFCILSSKLKEIAESQKEDSFLQYKIYSSTFSLSETQGSKFFFSFTSNSEELLKIKKIVLSFGKNPHFYSSPGHFSLISDDDYSLADSTINKTTGFVLTGNRSQMISKKVIGVDSIIQNGHNQIKYSIDVKNEGKTPLRFYLLVQVFSKDGTTLNWTNYPYKKINKVLHVVSAEEGSSKIIVDSYPEWKKDCKIALNAKEDMSDVPCIDLLDGSIVEINKLEGDNAEIVLNKSLKQSLAKGTPIRITAAPSNANLYPFINILRPGENTTVDSFIEIDNKAIDFSNKVIPKGANCVSFGVLSVSLDDDLKSSKEENILLINKYEIDF